MSIVLGFQPERLGVKLSRFGDFVSALIYDDGNPATVNAWPLDAVIELRFYPDTTAVDPLVVWAADIDGDRASWHIPAVQVGTNVLDAGNLQARLFYSTDDSMLEWAVGAAKDVN